MYGHCDLTESMLHPSNSFIDDISDPTLFVASYCVAENAKALRKHQFRFFSSLFTQIPTNSVLLVIETTHRLYPEIIKAAFEGIEDSCDLDIIFPRISHSFRHGYALCIQKVVKSDEDKEIHGSYDTDIAVNDDNDALESFLVSRMRADSKVASLLHEFIRDNQLHEKRLIKQHEQKIMEKKVHEEMREKKLDALRLKLIERKSKNIREDDIS